MKNNIHNLITGVNQILSQTLFFFKKHNLRIGSIKAEIWNEHDMVLIGVRDAFWDAFRSNFSSLPYTLIFTAFTLIHSIIIASTSKDLFIGVVDLILLILALFIWLVIKSNQATKGNLKFALE